MLTQQYITLKPLEFAILRWGVRWGELFGPRLLFIWYRPGVHVIILLDL